MSSPNALKYLLVFAKIYKIIIGFRWLKPDDVAARVGEFVVIDAHRRHKERDSVTYVVVLVPRWYCLNYYFYWKYLFFFLSFFLLTFSNKLWHHISLLPPEIGEIESLKKIDLSLNPVLGACVLLVTFLFWFLFFLLFDTE